jgi:hypothetical protein
VLLPLLCVLSIGRQDRARCRADAACARVWRLSLTAVARPGHKRMAAVRSSLRRNKRPTHSQQAFDTGPSQPYLWLLRQLRWPPPVLQRRVQRLARQPGSLVPLPRHSAAAAAAALVQAAGAVLPGPPGHARGVWLRRLGTPAAGCWCSKHHRGASPSSASLNSRATAARTDWVARQSTGALRCLVAVSVLQTRP